MAKAPSLSSYQKASGVSKDYISSSVDVSYFDRLNQMKLRNLMDDVDTSLAKYQAGAFVFQEFNRNFLAEPFAEMKKAKELKKTYGFAEDISYSDILFGKQKMGGDSVDDAYARHEDVNRMREMFGKISMFEDNRDDGGGFDFEGMGQVNMYRFLSGFKKKGD